MVAGGSEALTRAAASSHERGGAAATEAEVEAFCRERMASYKVPLRIAFVDAIPKSPTGKILKRVLREG